MARIRPPVARATIGMSITGAIKPPADKSITHRALLLAGLINKPAMIRNVLASADTKSTARVLRQLGVQVGPMQQGGHVRVHGRRWLAPSGTLKCGNSGTTARLLLGALAGHRFEVRLDGDSSLRRRPMRRVTRPLEEMGAQIREERGDGLPLSIRGGRLKHIRYQSPVASAQIKSAILLAGLTARVPVTVVEPTLSRDHTERLLRFLGVEVQSTGAEVVLVCQGERWQETASVELTVPGDPSSAAFLLAAAALGGKRELLVAQVCVNPTRTGYLDVMRRMGLNVHVENESEREGELVADLVARPATLTGTEVHAGEIPGLIDEVPVLSVLAARASGETVFRSVGELRVKESNRLNSIAENLRRIGVEAEVCGDDLHICGSDLPLRGRVETAGDHRIAMAFSVLGTVPRVHLELSELASPGVSYPRFFEDLQIAGGYG
jgi:3-phosphoshikimate 1-carboxyvinyltransferase